MPLIYTFVIVEINVNFYCSCEHYLSRASSVLACSFYVSEWVSSVLRPLQHSIGYMGDGVAFTNKCSDLQWTYCTHQSLVNDCVLDAVDPEPSKLLLPTTDYLYNMTANNISQWLVKTTMDYLKKRCGLHLPRVHLLYQSIYLMLLMLSSYFASQLQT